MKIAIIGPGLQPIPSVGWGAVEQVCWQYKLSLEKAGHQVTIYNNQTESWRQAVDEINALGYDFVHNMYDDNAEFLNRYLKVPFVTTTHYGYLTKESEWGGYWHLHSNVMKCPGIMALSESIKNKYGQDGYTGPIKVLRNGSDVGRMKFYPAATKDIVCVGKIEHRKQQTKLANICRNKLSIDFVGPITDAEFETNETCKYLGEWTREQLNDQLSNYKVLVLPSFGEAAALVVPEAIAAGLTVVVTEAASANLEGTPSYKVVPDDLAGIVNALRTAVTENSGVRKKQRAFAEQRFDWNVIIKEYIEEVIPFFKNEWSK